MAKHGLIQYYKLSITNAVNTAFAFFIVANIAATFCRMFFIIKNGGGNYSFLDFIAVLLRGARFDAKFIGIFLLIILVFSFVKYRSFAIKVLVISYIFITVFLCFLNDGFYEIFGNTLNSQVFGIIFDDKEALFKTAVDSDYHITLRLFATFALTFLFFKLFDKIQINIPIKSVFIVPIIYIALCIFLARGYAISGRSLGDQHIGIVQDQLLNKATAGANYNAYNLFYLYKQLDSIDRFPLLHSLEGKCKMVKTLFNTHCDFPLDILELSKKVKTSEKSDIDHIFLIVVESLPAWHTKDKYDVLGINNGVKTLLKNGKQVPHFFSGGIGTIPTLNVLFSGLANNETFINYPSGKTFPYIFSANNIAKNAKYKTRFFYGGFDYWQNIGNIASSFDEQYFARDSKAKKTAWGIPDIDLFKIIDETLARNADAKSFNMILTTSSHAPFDIDFADSNISLDLVESNLRANFPDSTMPIKQIASMKYADKAVFDFVSNMSQKYKKALFIITGDHFMGMPDIPTRKDGQSVPLIFYGNTSSVNPANIGSHLDIGASIAELLLNKGDIYHSLGDSFVNNKDKENTFGSQILVNKQGEILNDGESKVEAVKALSYYIFKNGYILE